MSLSVKAVQEQIGELLDEATAINGLAEKEERDLNDEEKTRVDEIFGLIGVEEDEENGKPTGLRADLARAQRMEDEQRRVREQRLAFVRANQPSSGPKDGLQTPEGQEGQDDNRPRAERITIPAKARRGFPLKAFAGDNAEKDAYLSGQFFLALYGHSPARQWCQDNGVPIVKAAMSGGDNTLGGWLIPVEMERNIINLRETFGVFRREAMQVSMASDTKDQPRRTAGLTASWVGDNDSITASDPNFDNVRLVAKKLAALVRLSSEVEEGEVIGLADFLAAEFAQDFAHEEDKAGFLGDGTSTYGGIQGLISAVADGSKVTAATGETSFGALTLATFEDMVGKLPQYADVGNAKWYISRAGWGASMQRLADAAGGNTTETIAAGPSQRLFLGYPVVFAQVMNSTLTAQTSTDGLVYFGDLRQTAMLGNRRGMSIRVSEDRYFEQDQIAVRATERLDINVHETGDATTAGSIIMLSTPSS